MAEPKPTTSASAPRDPLRRVTAIATAILSGAVFAFACVMIPVILWNRGSLPPLTQERFNEARKTWKANGPASYDVEIEVVGRQSATYRVQVRGGVVQTALRNGQPLKQARTMGTWSVPGMFGTIAIDMENVRKVLEGNADRATPQLTLRGTFHSELGYPQSYYRVEKVKRGSNPEVSWRVVSFDIVES